MASLITSATSSSSSSFDNNLYGGYMTTSDLKFNYYDRDLSYEAVMQQVSDSNLPIVDSNEWDKISNMLSSDDIELIKLGFQLLTGYRFPKGVINLTIIHKAINKYLKEINK